MKWCWILLSLPCIVSRTIASVATPPNSTETASETELPSSTGTPSIASSLPTAVEEAYEQFDNKPYCFGGNYTGAVDSGMFENWARDFCRQTHEPLSPENGVYNSFYTHGRLGCDFFMHWDSLNMNCTGHRDIDPDACCSSLLDIEKKCSSFGRGGTMAQDCIVYTFSPS